MKRWVKDLYQLAMRLGRNELPQLVDELDRLNDNLEELVEVLDEPENNDEAAPAPDDPSP
jgi:hypothetical protein